MKYIIETHSDSETVNITIPGRTYDRIVRVSNWVKAYLDKNGDLYNLSLNLEPHPFNIITYPKDGSIADDIKKQIDYAFDAYVRYAHPNLCYIKYLKEV